MATAHLCVTMRTLAQSVRSALVYLPGTCASGLEPQVHMKMRNRTYEHGITELALCNQICLRTALVVFNRRGYRLENDRKGKYVRTFYLPYQSIQAVKTC